MKTASPVALTLSVALAACGSAEETAAEPDPVASASTPASPAAAPSDEPSQVQTEPMVALDGEGLRIVVPSGPTRLLAFGSERAEVERIVGQTSGIAPSRSENGECGAGPMQMTAYDYLTLNYQDGAFVGWSLRERMEGFETTKGVGVGSTLREFRAAYGSFEEVDSTLGMELFSQEDGIGAIIVEGEVEWTVDLLYAGTNCFFR